MTTAAGDPVINGSIPIEVRVTQSGQYRVIAKMDDDRYFKLAAAHNFVRTCSGWVINVSDPSGGRFECGVADFALGPGLTTHVKVYPAPTDSGKSMVLSTIDDLVLVSGMPIILDVLTFDRYGNSREVGGDSFDIAFKSSPGLRLAGTTPHWWGYKS